ncbi:unnamed protein product [Amoebophrya sp. A120]|nr:unnamed protein product [Amoebophrya sp. A120]|eukprot:GSA120T00014398001.1
MFEVLMRTVGKDYDKITTTRAPTSEHEPKKTHQHSEVKEAERVLLQVLQTCVDLNPFLKLYGEESVAKVLRFFVNMKTQMKGGREDENLREGPRADHPVQEVRAVSTSHATSSSSHATTLTTTSSPDVPATTSSSTSRGAGPGETSTTRNNYRRTWASLLDTVRFDRI